MIHVLENLELDTPNRTCHYWVFNINLRDGRFEVFDSLRLVKKSKRLDGVARCIVASVRTLWDIHYPEQAKIMEKFPLVDIDAPKQIIA